MIDTTLSAAPPRIAIKGIRPLVEAGRFAAKRCVGDVVEVSADVFRDGHEHLLAVVLYRPSGRAEWLEAPMRPVPDDHAGARWAGSFTVDQTGRWEFRIEAWTDLFGTWRDELQRKAAAGQADLEGELSEGRLLIEQGVARATSRHAKDLLHGALRAIAPGDGQDLAQALRHEVHETMIACAPRTGATTSDEAAIEVDRVRARFGSWYELFPRSWGGLAGVRGNLERLAELGFDVLYLPPIHPIGLTNRKGRNNAPVAGPGDPGSPWAIGSPEGGHDTVHPELGDEAELRALVAEARALGIDVALDFAIQCSADHPWLSEHPEWFHRRPDGTLKYAENPPKRYQDIYNVNWESEDWLGLWHALRDIVVHWVDCGVKVFRVDNPHTKPFAFWEWLIAEVHAVDRDVIFLSEAFTRRAVMRHLAQLGFTQSYTYFTWMNGRQELIDYVNELAYSDDREYLRPNFFANTPDILHEYLQRGGPPAFAARLVLAATLSPAYGIYSGFESFEGTPVAEGSEEYLDSEKYELRERALDGPLLPLVKRVNELRRASPALQAIDNVTFLETENEALIAYCKRTGSDVLLIVVNLDPHAVQEGLVVVPARLGTAPAFTVTDELTGERYAWRLGPNYVRLDPAAQQAHVMRVTR